ncbi:hypothetical protein SAMN05421737_101338 [Shouchella lonarensis]|uniref:Uncharacterized protein n=1 Tax=Shouchella lonarensis TaxID=1464122 RepID=A0A1G6GPR6_9BACI|nr:hypothetical protein SAMN05421737_101338 [Shouchella lonarensis]
MYKTELEALIYQDIMNVTAQGAPLSYTAQVDAVKEAYPDATLLSFMITDNKQTATEF